MTVATCKEQLLYEIHDPAAYVTPDVVADFSQRARDATTAPDRVAVDGATGRPRRPTLKVSLGYRDGFIGEGQISYAGPGAVDRGAAGGVRSSRERLAADGVRAGRDALRPDRHRRAARRARSRRHRASRTRCACASRRATRTIAARPQRIGNEVEALYTNGPAGGGGATQSTREVLAMASTFVPRELRRLRGRAARWL